MVEIKELAASQNMIIVATIHQPSSKVYNGFDQIMIPRGGRMAYCGDATDAPAHFSSLGWPMSANTNPAEFYLDLVNADFVAAEEVTKILDAWLPSKAALKNSRSIEDVASGTGPGAAAEAGAAGGVSLDGAGGGSEQAGGESLLLHEMRIMLQRHSLLVVRDPVLYIGRACIFMVSNAYFSFVYWKARERAQDQVMNRMWLLIWFIGVAANMGVVAVFALNEEYKSVHREIKNGMVSPYSYVFAKTVFEIPIMFLFAFFALLLPAYVLSNFYFPNVLPMALVWAVSIYAWEVPAEALSVTFGNPLLGMMSFMGFWFSAFLFMGVLIPGSDLVWLLKVFFHILPMKYGLRSMVWIEYIDSEWESCTDPTAICFGKDGDDVLTSLNYLFPLFSDENTMGEDIGIMLAISAVFKIVYVALVALKSCRVSTLDGPLDPKEMPKTAL